MTRRGKAKGLVALLILLAGLAAAYLREPQSAPRRPEPEGAAPAARPPVPKGESFQGRVVGVHDGDTATVLWQQREIKLRLFGIDAPETNPAQDYGQRAKQFASQLIFNQDVRVVVRDATLTYGRVVGEIFMLVDGREQSVNAKLVEAGMAWAYLDYSDAFAAEEARARAAKTGLWASPNPMPPWEFRKERRSR